MEIHFNPVEISMKYQFKFQRNTNGIPWDIQLQFQRNTNGNPLKIQLKFTLKLNWKQKLEIEIGNLIGNSNGHLKFNRNNKKILLSFQ